MSAIAAAEPAVPVNPLDINYEDSPARVLAAVDKMVDSVVGTMEEELRRQARRQQVKTAVYYVLQTRKEFDKLLPAMTATPGMVGLLLDGYRAELVTAYATINPDAPAATVDAAVDAFLGEYRKKYEPEEAKPKRGKSSAG